MKPFTKVWVPAFPILKTIFHSYLHGSMVQHLLPSRVRDFLPLHVALFCYLHHFFGCLMHAASPLIHVSCFLSFNLNLKQRIILLSKFRYLCTKVYTKVWQNKRTPTNHGTWTGAATWAANPQPPITSRAGIWLSYREQPLHSGVVLLAEFSCLYSQI